MLFSVEGAPDPPLSSPHLGGLAAGSGQRCMAPKVSATPTAHPLSAESTWPIRFHEIRSSFKDPDVAQHVGSVRSIQAFELGDDGDGSPIQIPDGGISVAIFWRM